LTGESLELFLLLQIFFDKLMLGVRVLQLTQVPVRHLQKPQFKKKIFPIVK
jgi:hypothetical protein